MNCDAVTKSIALYCYGELAPDVEDRVEEHLDACEECRGELEKHKAMSAALDRHRISPPAELLSECRHELARAIYREESPVARRISSDPWALFRDAFSSLLHPGIRFRQPAGALALVALGFFAARISGTWNPATTLAGFTPDAVVSSIRSVQPDNAGRVQISLDETHRRVISGRLDDQNIQRLLLAAAREQDNPGVRVESVGLLKDHGGPGEIRSALLEAVAHDPNPGVRLKALEGLKRFSADGDVRRTLAQVLLKDQNSAIRIQVIDLLVANQDPSTVSVLQTLIGKEDNNYVRMRCRDALREMNASVGTF